MQMIGRISNISHILASSITHYTCSNRVMRGMMADTMPMCGMNWWFGILVQEMKVVEGNVHL
jgi:hypothetical protein